MRDLAVYLSEVSGQKFSPGKMDCAILMSDWLVRCGLADPIADLRGNYRSERDYLKIWAREGGFIACCTTRLERIGMVKTDQPRAGDVSIALTPHPVGAICLDNDMRAVISDGGLVIAQSRFVKSLIAWTIPGG